jgi:hypothetical protein
MYSVRNTQSEGNLQVLQRLFSAESHRKITQKAEKEIFFLRKAGESGAKRKCQNRVPYICLRNPDTES